MFCSDVCTTYIQQNVILMLTPPNGGLVTTLTEGGLVTTLTMRVVW